MFFDLEGQGPLSTYP